MTDETTPAPEEAPAEEAAVEAPVADLSAIHATLRKLEFAGKENGSPACPTCKAHIPLDADNPRDWERHAADCDIAAALAATA